MVAQLCRYTKALYMSRRAVLKESTYQTYWLPSWMPSLPSQAHFRAGSGSCSSSASSFSPHQLIRLQPRWPPYALLSPASASPCMLLLHLDFCPLIVTNASFNQNEISFPDYPLEVHSFPPCLLPYCIMLVSFNYGACFTMDANYNLCIYWWTP